ncbi:hypothetical protein S7S_16655 [Isoalcanivorax pacificus W11-5]|uniref:Uncharacterized protein n=1 Tax=Isoalcanivorax pacificus W11-5 TaxID=391936 RepID=A0A0B4XTA4_9GAMM|nr:hypothetical protein S7S_16655 [Isoalcanivorax pacificus W11-5]
MSLCICNVISSCFFISDSPMKIEGPFDISEEAEFYFVLQLPEPIADSVGLAKSARRLFLWGVGINIFLNVIDEVIKLLFTDA